MELQILQWGATALLAGVTWFMKRTINEYDSRIKNLDDEVKARITKEEFREWKSDIKDMLGEIRQDLKDLKNEKNHVAR